MKGPGGKNVRVFKMTFARDRDELGRKMQQDIEEDRKKKLPEVVAQLRRAKAVAEQVAAAVKDGRYATREAADDAFQRAIPQTSKDGR